MKNSFECIGNVSYCPDKDNKVRSIKVWLARYRDELLLHYPKSYSIRKAILQEYEKIIMEVDENYD